MLFQDFFEKEKYSIFSTGTSNRGGKFIFDVREAVEELVILCVGEYDKKVKLS